MRRLIWVAAILAGVFAFIRHFPLAWAARSVPPSVGAPTGTVWNGQFLRVPLLGSVSVKSALSGITVATPPGDTTVRATLTPNTVSDLVLSMPVSRLPMSDARLAGLQGRFSLRLDEAERAGDQCISASGTASTDLLASNAAQLGWRGPELSGPVDCVDGRLRVRLSGENADGSVEALTLTGMDGLYQSEITVDTDDPAAGNALVLFGFAPEGDGQYRLSEQGRWR